MKLAIEIVLQTLLAFFSTFFFARLIGKKQIGELTFYDYVNGITFGSIAGNLATDINQKTWQYFIGIILFAVLTIFFQYLALKSRKARKVVEGEPTVLIHRGKILEENMKKTRFNIDDLISQLREKNIFNIEDVHYAVLETDGKLSVMPTAQQRTVTPQDLGLEVEEKEIWSELIADGQIIKSNLRQHNLTEDWLNERLRENQINKVEEVVLANYDPLTGDLYFDLKEDNLDENKVDISD